MNKCLFYKFRIFHIYIFKKKKAEKIKILRFIIVDIFTPFYISIYNNLFFFIKKINQINSNLIKNLFKKILSIYSFFIKKD